LVRHAYADWTPDEDRLLSAQGNRDAEILAEKLSAHPIDEIFSSPSLRAIQTVQPLADRLGLVIKKDDRFRERSLGRFEDISFKEAVRRTWADFEFAYPGGETNAAAQVRAVQAVQEIITSQGSNHVVIGTHGNVLALILNYFDSKVGFDFWSALSMPDVHELEINL